jgi:hypothetical protein
MAKVAKVQDESPKSVMIRADYESYRKMAKADLKGVVSQSYRIVDLSECDKQSLISMILCARYGRKSVEIAFA